jgi:diadenosine tetraphosphatase ApaH/serine/threonine PP2A family protein phosphatase
MWLIGVKRNASDRQTPSRAQERKSVAVKSTKMDLTLLFSDVHGKADRLRRLFRLYPDTRAICLGDAVGIGDSNATLDLLKVRGIPCVVGNHEIDLIHLYEVHADHRGWIRTWPFEISDNDMMLAHTWLEGRIFHCIDSISTVGLMFASADFRVTFVGHSHSPGWWELPPGDRPRWTHASNTPQVNWREGSRYVVDVGSLGEPQSPEDPNYALWDEVGVRWLKLPDY